MTEIQPPQSQTPASDSQPTPPPVKAPYIPYKAPRNPDRKPSAKPLTPEQKYHIYRLYSRPIGHPDRKTMKQLATQYDVSSSVIFRAIHDESYRMHGHIPKEDALP